MDDLVPSEQLREQHRVTEARDRKQLRDALEDPEHDRTEGRETVIGSQREHERGTLARLSFQARTGYGRPARRTARPAPTPGAWPRRCPGTRSCRSGA